MRIRSIKPEFWRSDDIAILSIEDRLLFIGLWSYVDDNGVGLDNLAMIAADLFAADLLDDARETFARVSRGLQKLSEAGRIVRYSLAGKDYLFVVNWDRHQRIDKPNKARFPLPTSDNASIRDTLATSSRDSRETPAPGTGEQRNRGTEDQGNRGADSSADADDAPPHDPTVEDLCTHLAARIEANGSKRPPVTKRWRQACRLMLDRDQRTPEQIRAAIDWCQADDFWRSNVMSMPKLREKFDTLRLQAGRSRAASSQRIATADQRLADGMALARKLAAEESQTRLELGA